jgi:DNA-directed RNA polymerase subunit RPC12/RpoP
VTLSTKKRKTWLCMKCGHRNEVRTSSRKCQNPDCLAPDGKRKKPVKKHREVLHTMGYEDWAALSVMIHGGDLYACGACGKPPAEGRKHDRDHDHRTGLARGLACPGNSGCNYLMLPWVTAATARGISKAKIDAGEHDGIRWSQIADYLERSERFHAGSQ